MSPQDRACPACRSGRSELLLRVSTEELFEANWSYRRDRMASLGDAAQALWPVHRCLDCNFAFSARTPGGEVLAAIYEEVIDEAGARAASFEPAGMAMRMDYVATLLRLLPSGRASKVLDFGCGFGPTLQLLTGLRNVSVLGFDTSAVRIDELVARGLPATRRLEEVAQQARYDAIIADNVLEHVLDPAQCLAQFAAWSQPGTVLYLSVPDASIAVLERARRGHEEGARWPMDVNPLEHLNYFSLEHLDRMAAAAGFEPMRQSRLPEAVDAGIRAEQSGLPRAKNALASLPRLARYVLRGDALATVTRRFYRFG
jgi:SAM-dependent methyltransferase